MSYPIVDLTFWNPGDPGTPEIDALLADPATPLAKHGLTGIASAYAEATGAFMHDVHQWWANELAMKSLAVDGALTEVVPTLRQAALSFFVAKGPTMGHVDYSDSRLRTYSDLDVYVTRASLDDARDALAVLGYRAVRQRRGQLGGVGRELYGGGFGAIVEVHDTVVDNVHRRYLPPVEDYLAHVEHRRVVAVDVPVLRNGAHLALQAVHLGAGHRYAKAILFRDIASLLPFDDRATVRALGATRYLDTITAVLSAMRVEPDGRAASGGILQRRLAAALTAANPVEWDEHRVSVTNALALLNQQGLRHKARAAMSGGRALLPARGRRVSLALRGEPRREAAPA